MNALLAFASDIFGLFVDDGSLALAVLVWVALVGLASALLPVPSAAIGILIFLGCAAILAENVLRRARRR
jgi:hypothetical protein